MFKSLLLITLLVACSSAKFLSVFEEAQAQATCVAGTYSCAAVGGSCAGTATASVDCPGSTLCFATSSGGAPTCQNPVAVGAYCSNSRYCASGLCQNSVCVATTAAAIGAACSATQLCNSYNAVCSSTSKTCVAMPGVGAACPDFQCSGAASCNSVNGVYTCVKFGTAAAGANCSTPFDCNAGLFCNTANLQTTGVAVCATPVATTPGKACTSSSDCNTANGETCGCTTTSGSTTCQPPTTYSATLLNNAVSAYNCFTSSQCTPNNANYASCCKSQVCSSGGYSYNAGECNNWCSSASFATISVFGVIAAFFAYLF